MRGLQPSPPQDAVTVDAMSSSASEVEGAIFVPVDGAGLTPTDPSAGLSDFDELGMKVIKAGNMTSVIALHHGYGLEAATTQQDPATFWGSNLFGDLVLLANVQFSSPTLAMLLQQEDGKRWRSCMPSGLCTKVVFNKDVAPIDLMRLVPVVEAFLLLGAETTPLPFMMATLALACLVLAARRARTLASIAGSPPMGAGAPLARTGDEPLGSSEAVIRFRESYAVVQGMRFGDRGTKSIVAADVDGDGDLDLLLGNYDSPSRVLFNAGDGTFPTFIELPGGGTSTRSIAAADVDGDGDLDVLLGNYGSPSRVLINAGDGTFPTSME
eukprot:jgi/Chrpa1/9006/Chrysochromulina_OHIO_Genome00016930-RA